MNPESLEPTAKTRVLILGGGFAGLYAALQLEKTIAAAENIEVPLVSGENFVLFTPTMLHEVAAAELEMSDIVNPIRKMLRQSRYEIWSLRHRWRRVSRGKILRIIHATEATIVWSSDDWTRTNRSDTPQESELNLWFADFPTAEWPVGSVITFTCFWNCDQGWQGENWQVSVV